MTRKRLRGLMAAGLIDSFGLALGWTVFSLYAVSSQGLGALGTYNAAMLVGVALSAPATAWLSRRLDGRRLLQSTAALEMVLRITMFILLLSDAPVALIATVVLVANVAAWSGYAGMRSEVVAADSRTAAITRYMVGIAAIEAVGTATAALLPVVGAKGTPSGRLLAVVVIVYGASLLPTFLVARRARVRRSSATRGVRSLGRPPAAFLGAGFMVMALASGPTLLSVGLALKLHGRLWVAAAAIAFTVGALAAPTLVRLMERLELPALTCWSLLGVGMVAGWIVAPWHPAGLLLAQCLSGLSLAALEGTMDARVARVGERSEVTARLAWTAAARALGGSVAVGMTPAVIGAASLATLSIVAGIVLVAVSLLRLVAPMLGRKLTTLARGPAGASRGVSSLRSTSPLQPGRFVQRDPG